MDIRSVQSKKISENLCGLDRDRRTTEEEEEEDPARRLSRHHNTAAAPTCPWRPSTSRMRRVSSCLGLPLPGTAPGCCGAGQGAAGRGRGLRHLVGSWRWTAARVGQPGSSRSPVPSVAGWPRGRRPKGAWATSVRPWGEDWGPVAPSPEMQVVDTAPARDTSPSLLTRPWQG